MTTRWTVCAVAMGLFAAACWPESATVTYWGAVPGDGTSGDVDDTVNFTDHTNYWDYCYKVEYTDLTKGTLYDWWMFAPFEPVGFSTSGPGNAILQYSYDSDNHRVYWYITLKYGAGPDDGTVYLQFWSDWWPRWAPNGGILQPNELGVEGGWTVQFGNQERPYLYTNPEPGTLSLAALALPFAALIRARRRRHEQ